MTQMQLPEKFLKTMEQILGEEYGAFLESFDGKRQFGLRVNTAKMKLEEFERIAPFHLSKIPWIADGYFYEEEDAPAKHPFYAAGLYYLQEPSAMTPASRLLVTPGERVLDLCAAPGGKATALGAKLQGEGLLVANDINNARAKALLRNLELFGISNAFVTNEPPHILAEHYPEYFDKIMVDAPCSGEGMFRKNPAVVEAWQEKGPEYFSRLQRDIILHAADMLRPGGRMLYSTCTFSPLENESVITHLLRERPEMEVIPMEDYEGFAEGLTAFGGEQFHESCRLCRRIFPHRMAGEGHFLALLYKHAPDENSNLSANVSAPASLSVQPENVSAPAGLSGLSENVSAPASLSVQPENVSAPAGLSGLSENVSASVGLSVQPENVSAPAGLSDLPENVSAPAGLSGKDAEKKSGKRKKEKKKKKQSACTDGSRNWWDTCPGLDREQRQALADFFVHVHMPLQKERIDIRGDKVYYVPAETLFSDSQLRSAAFSAGEERAARTRWSGAGGRSSGGKRKQPGAMPTAKIHFLRNGLYMGDLKKKRFEPSQPFALALSKDAFDQCLNFAGGDERLQRYLRGESIPLEEGEAAALNCRGPEPAGNAARCSSTLKSAGNTASGGWYLVLADGCPLGFGKLAGHILKNKYPAGWRRN